MHLNQAIDHYLDAVHCVGKYYSWIADTTLHLPFNFLLLRQGNQAAIAYPETISHAECLFGPARINRLLVVSDDDMSKMDRQLRIDIEEVFKVVAFELNYLMDQVRRVENKIPCVNEMSRLIMAFKDTFNSMYMRQVESGVAINYLRDCQNSYLESRLTWLTK